MIEQDFENALVDLARTFGWRVAGFRPARTTKGWRTPVKHDGKGWPDLVLVHRHHGVIFAELKAEKGRRSTDQIVWGDRLFMAGEEYYVWRPSDADTIASILSFGRVTQWNLTP